MLCIYHDMKYFFKTVVLPLAAKSAALTECIRLPAKMMSLISAAFISSSEGSALSFEAYLCCTVCKKQLCQAAHIPSPIL